MNPAPESLALGPPINAVSSDAVIDSPSRRRPPPLVPLLLALLALLDLRVELQLLFDHLTLTSLTEAVRTHLLAVMVLLFTPSLLRRYR
jgi:hypothetical protein